MPPRALRELDLRREAVRAIGRLGPGLSLEADAAIGEALGQAYIAKTFPPRAKARAKSVIDDIRASFGERVKALDWMSPKTKQAALDKLAKMGEKVGYPDIWRDYSKLLSSIACSSSSSGSAP